MAPFQCQEKNKKNIKLWFSSYSKRNPVDLNYLETELTNSFHNEKKIS